MLCSLEDLLDCVTTIREYAILCLSFQKTLPRKYFMHIVYQRHIEMVQNINSLHLQNLDFGFVCLFVFFFHMGEHLKTSTFGIIIIVVSGYLNFSLYSSKHVWKV